MRTSKVKYPGIYLSMKNLDLFKNNYEKLWEAIQLDLKKGVSLLHFVSAEASEKSSRGAPLLILTLRNLLMKEKEMVVWMT